MSKSTSLQTGLRPKGFLPDFKRRAQVALERHAFARREVTEVERRDSASDGTSFVVWTSEGIDGIPSTVLGFPVEVKVVDDSPELMS